jgi:ABC-type multidrug transport system ATPase subunit
MPKPLPPVLQVRGLCFAYPGQAALFADWRVDLPAGLTLLDGDSGKTTLMRLLAGELAADAGELTLVGHRLDAEPLAYRQQCCWFDPRDPAWDAMTPEAMMAAQRALHPGLDLAAWRRHLAGFDLTPHLAKPMYALSTGSRRKAGLAAALATGAALTLLDEPCAGLDPPSLAYLARALNDAAHAAHAAHEPARAMLLAGAQALEGLALAGVIRLADLP